MLTTHDRGGGHGSSHGIDLAPMLDFVVNLLVFFIVTAVFIKQSALTVQRPTSASSDSSLVAANSIEVRENGTIVIGGREIDLRAVRANVERMIASNASSQPSSVLILAHEKAPTGTLVAVVDQVHLGGIDDVTFSTAQ
jgi:biopolymer transport protein ExbD